MPCIVAEKRKATIHKIAVFIIFIDLIIFVQILFHYCFNIGNSLFLR